MSIFYAFCIAFGHNWEWGFPDLKHRTCERCNKIERITN